MTVESFAALHTPERGVTLYCPDAPMVQVGGFNFGKVHDAVPRDAQPLLLAWPMNNYWNTNFALVQPGPVHFRYELETHGAFDAARALAHAQMVTTPVLEHPAFRVNGGTEGRFLTLDDAGVVVKHMKVAADGRGIIVQVTSVNETETRVRLALDGSALAAAYVTSPLEEDRTPLPVTGDGVWLTLAPRQLTTLRLCKETPGTSAAAQ